MNELSPKTQMNIQKWLDVIHRCRDSGLSNRQWCEENGIGLKSYYYWFSKIRKLAIESFPRKPSASSALPSTISGSAPATFAEIPMARNSSWKVGWITIHLGNAVLEVPVNAQDSLIQSIILTVSKC